MLNLRASVRVTWLSMALSAGGLVPLQTAHAEQTSPQEFSRVLLSSDRPVNLTVQPEDAPERLVVSSESADWQKQVLEYRLPRNGDYRISGMGVTEREFQLDDSYAVRLEVKTGRRAYRTAGIALLASGAVLSSAGLLAIGIGKILALNSPAVVGPPGWLSAPERALAVGAPSLSVGLIAVVIGAAFAGIGRTGVKMSPLPGSAELHLPAALRISSQGLVF